MPKVCAVAGCTETATAESPVSFHRFPKDPYRKKEWAIKVNRKGPTGKLWMPKDHDAICSKHFVYGDFTPRTHRSGKDGFPQFVPELTADAVPSVFPHNEGKRKRQQEAAARRSSLTNKRRRREVLDQAMSDFQRCDHMASHDQLVKSGVKIEIDVAEGPGPEWMTQDQSSHEDETSAFPENNVRIADRLDETDTDYPLAANIKSKPTEDTDTCQGIKTEPETEPVTYNEADCTCPLATNIKSEPVEQTDTFQGIQTEPVEQSVTSNQLYQTKPVKSNVSRHTQMKAATSTRATATCDEDITEIISRSEKNEDKPPGGEQETDLQVTSPFQSQLTTNEKESEGNMSWLCQGSQTVSDSQVQTDPPSPSLFQGDPAEAEDESFPNQAHPQRSGRPLRTTPSPRPSTQRLLPAPTTSAPPLHSHSFMKRKVVSRRKEHPAQITTQTVREYYINKIVSGSPSTVIVHCAQEDPILTWSRDLASRVKSIRNATRRTLAQIKLERILQEEIIADLEEAGEDCAAE